MSHSHANKLIVAGISIPVAAALWALFSSNPYLTIAVSLVAIVLSIALVLGGAMLGGINLARSRGAVPTKDLVLLAVGINALLFVLAFVFVIWGRNA